MTKGGGRAVSGGLSPSGWLRRPLCRRYILGAFDVAVVRLRDGDGCRDHRVHWASGWLADGECEALGAWIEADGGSQNPLRMMTDLAARGVERISQVTGTDSVDLRGRVAAAFAGAALPSPCIDPPRAEAIAASPRCVRPSPEHAAQQVRESLIRGIRRHGSFVSEAAVLDFFAGALQRMERRLDRGGVMATVSVRHETGERPFPLGI